MSAVYEGVVLFAVLVFAAYMFSAPLRFTAEPGPMNWAFRAWLVIVVGIYFGWFWSHGRRTLPMKTIGLRLVDLEDRPLSRARAVGRYAACCLVLAIPVALVYLGGSPLWLLLLPVPFFSALVDPQRRTLYDRLAGTRLVIDTRPTP
ncbi:MAG: RDD family protein [Burkholderiales bacterium]|nr:MAG: RDD family protein [Burkholderiales bacterium]